MSSNLIELGDRGEADPNAPRQRIVEFLNEAYRDARGVHAETILNAVGALAGFAAQQAIWEGVVRPGKMSAKQAFVEVRTKDGSVYYFGDFLNTILASTAKGELSIWGFVAGAALKCGATMLPSLPQLFEHCAKSVGQANFGVPQWAAAQGALLELPWDALRHWPQVKAILIDGGKQPLHWPLEIAVAAQALIKICAENKVIEPGRASLIVMEAAIPMSKIDPRTVPGGGDFAWPAS